MASRKSKSKPKPRMGIHRIQGQANDNAVQTLPQKYRTGLDRAPLNQVSVKDVMDFNKALYEFYSNDPKGFNDDGFCII